MAHWAGAKEKRLLERVRAVLMAADPERFFRPPYVGPRGWIGLRLDVQPDWNQVAAVIDEAYQTVAGKHRRRR
jgi:hypothetical protein